MRPCRSQGSAHRLGPHVSHPHRSVILTSHRRKIGGNDTKICGKGPEKVDLGLRLALALALCLKAKKTVSKKPTRSMVHQLRASTPRYLIGGFNSLENL